MATPIIIGLGVCVCRSRLRHSRLAFAPHAGERRLDLLLEAGDQFAVGADQRLLGFDLGHDGLLCAEGREGDSSLTDGRL